MLTSTGLAFLANETKSACWLDIKVDIYVANVETISTLYTLSTRLFGSLLVDH